MIRKFFTKLNFKSKNGYRCKYSGRSGFISFFWSPFFVTVLFAFSANALAAPSVNSVSGNVSHGQTVTISGDSFSNSGKEIPIKFDNFETGSLGNSLAKGGWRVDTSNSPNPSDSPPVYSNSRVYAGSKSAYVDISSGGDCAAYLSGLHTKQLYVSLMFNYTISGSPKTTKGVRIHAADGPNIYSSRPNVNVQDFYSTNRHTISPFDDTGDKITDYSPSNFSTNKWHRIEYWFKISDPAGSSNGQVLFWLNLGLNSNWSGVSRDSGVSDIYELVMLPFYVGNGGTGKLWYDDVYISKSRARVELGNASTWSGCTKREIQPPVSWSDNSISFRVNNGKFKNGDTAYLYVIDANGNVNSTGYPIVIGGGSSSNPPNPPEGLQVVAN